MGVSVAPDPSDELDKALSEIRGRKSEAADPMDAALAEIRKVPGKREPVGDIDLREPAAPMRLRPVVVSKPEGLDELTKGPFADSLSKIGGRPNYGVAKDRSEPGDTGTARMGATRAAGDSTLLTPFTLAHRNDKGDAGNSGYPPVEGQTWGDRVLAHEYGHHLSTAAKDTPKEKRTPFQQSIVDVASKMDPETFAEHFNAAAQALRDPKADLTKLDPDAQQIAALLQTQPPFAPRKRLGSIPRPPVAAPDMTRVGAEPVGLEERLRNEHPTLLDATVQGAKSMVEHPIDTGIALAETPFKGGEAVGEYVKGGRLNKGKGRAAAVGAAQTAAMLFGGPAERLAEPIVTGLAGELAGPIIARAGVGAAAGATFTPDRPGVGAILGGAAGALSGIGVGAEKAAARQARFEELAAQHPDWFGEAIAPEAPKQLGDGKSPATATARLVDEQAPPVDAEPDFTVDEPQQPIIDQKGVFGGALEQHGKDYVQGKVAPPTINEVSTTPESVVEPETPINPRGEEAPAAPQLPATVEEVDDAMDANAARYRDSTDPAERRNILQLQELLEDHRESLAPTPQQEGYKYSSTQLDLPPETAGAIKQLGDMIPDEHLAEDGREDNPHVTVKYGLHGEDPEAVRQLLANEPPVTVKLGKTSFFPNGESDSGDVLKVDVDSPALHRLNKKIADALPHTDTHPTYKPHATVAYLKPGMGKKYAGDKSLVGHTVTIDHVTFSSKDGTKHAIALGGKTRKLGVRKEKPVAEPVHETARMPNGRLRDKLETVKNDGLIHEMFKLLGAEDQTDQQRAIYRTVTDDPNMSGPVTVPTIRGGRNLQAEALHRLELKKGAAKRIEAILNARGLTDEHITHRYAELTETEADAQAEREGLDEDKGDTSFDFEEEGGNNGSDVRAVERTAAEGEGANAPAEEASAGGAGAAGQGESGRAPQPETSEVARKRAELYHELHTAATPNARFNVIERIKALDRPKPEIKGAISAGEMAERARAGETRDAVRDITGEEPTELSRDKKQSEMFGSEVETPKPPDEQNALFAMQKVAVPQTEAAKSESRALIESLDKGVGVSAGRQIYDTRGIASEQTLAKIAQRPHTRQLAERFGKVFDDIVAAISKRYSLPAVEFGGFDVRRGSLGININRGVLAKRSVQVGVPVYHGPTSNLLLVNPYSMLLEVGLSARVRPSEYAAALSEGTFATIVHELAHQNARAHDELFSGYHTRYAGAAAAVAERSLAELDAAWEVALSNGIQDDVLTLQHEVWNAAEQSEYDEGDIAIGSEPPARSENRLSVGSDAAASHLRSSEGDGGLGKGDGRRRLGLRSAVRGSAKGSQGAGTQRTESGGSARAGEGEPQHSAPAGGELDLDNLRLPEPSGLTQPRNNIRPAEFVRAIKSFFNPESLGPEAEGAAGTIKHKAAEAYRRVAITTHALKDFKDRIDKLPRKEQVQLWDDAEHGRPTGNAEMDEGYRLLRKATEQRTQQLIALDRLKAERAIENYIGRFWSQTTAKSGRDFLRAIMGRRPFEGPKSFLKGREMDWFVDGLKRDDLVPATYNYVESQLAKITEMERLIAAEHMLRQEKELGRAQPVMIGMEPPFDHRGEPWVKIDRTGEDPAFNIYMPPEVPHWEAVDTLVYGKLQKLIDSLNVQHLRSPKIGGSRLGYAEGDKFIATKFGGAEGVITHELGHILDARFGLGDAIDEAIGKAPRRTVTRGKRAGQQVPDYKTEGKEAAARRKALREELRQLANLRRETLAGVPSTKDLHPTDRAYLHSGPEKMANMVEAYVSARDRFRSVAPGIFQIFDKIVGDHSELHALRDIQPSLSREEHGSTTRVSGIITGGHWYAPKDGAAVWQNHLSKGLAGNPIYDAAIAPIHAGTQMLLGFSGFHGTVIATEGAFSDLALAIDNMVNRGGRSVHAPTQIGRALVSPIAGVTFGRRVMQEYRIPGTHPELKKVLDAMIAGGFRGKATSELWAGDRKERLKRAFRETLHAESKGRRLWGATKLPFDAIWAGVEAASGPLMSKYVPLMKTAATYNAVAQALEKLPANTTIDDMHRVMGDVVKEMDYRFGQVDYDNHFINRVAKDLAQLVFLAPGWTFGTLALAGRGLKDIATIPKRALRVAGARAEDAGYEPPPELIGKSAAYWIGAVLGTMLINGTLTYFNTGERPSGKDYWAFRDGTKDGAGNWNRHTVPGYLMHDIYGWGRHPVHTFKNKFAPTLAFFARLAENKDYFGDMVYDPDASLPTKLKQSGKALLKEHMPLSAQNYLEGKKRGEGGSGEVARNIFGVTPARRELVRTPAQNKLAEYLGRHAAATRTPEEADKGELHAKVTQAVRNGEQLPQAVLDGLSAGAIKRKTLFKWLGDSRQPSIVSQFKHLTVDEAKKVWDLANDDEKALWAQAYRTKIVNAQNQ